MPSGELGQPCPVQVSFTASAPQSHSTLRSIQNCSPVKLEREQKPVGAQSLPSTHGWQPSPWPRHEPKRCAQVATSSALSHTPHTEALPQGQESTSGSQRCVQIFSPL
jgi:hypothetical protein